jgi:REP element-mobilizing transposase RayT
MFFVKIDQLSIQNDHIHILLRAPRRADFQSFFRVVAGQIAQQFQKNGWMTDTPAARKGIWKFRPFTRVVRGWRALRTIRNYIQLNEKEATGKIPYRKERLRGLTEEEWKILWVT